MNVRVEIDVHFRDMDAQAERSIQFDGFFHFVKVRLVDIIVRLHTEALKRCAAVHQVLHEVINALALERVALVIIIIKELHVRGILAGQVIGHFQILHAAGDQIIGQAVGIVAITAQEHFVHLVGGCFVHHVPGIHGVAIALGDNLDVLLQALKHKLTGSQTAVCFKEPLRGLVVPHRRVHTHTHAVFLCKGNDTVGGFKNPFVLFGMHGLILHLILAGQTVEVLLQEICMNGQAGGRDGGADVEILFVRIAQRQDFLVHDNPPLFLSDNRA